MMTRTFVAVALRAGRMALRAGRMAHGAGRVTLGAGLAALASCASPGGPPLHRIAPEINATLLPVRQTLGPGDEIEVAFAPGALSDWTHTVIVRPDGRAAFLALEEMEVFGLAPSELQEALTRSYSFVADSPQLSINITSWAPRTFSVLGEVSRSGSFPVDPHVPVSFTEALAVAGGPRFRSAYLASTVMVRWDPETRRQRAWTIDARERHWAQPETILMQPFDLIFIPNTPVDKIANWLDSYIRVILPIPRVFVPAI